MSRVPPRTPPVERLLDRNKFAGRIDGETERRLRAVEQAAEDAKGTTITQTVTTPSTGTGGGSIPGSPTQYSAGAIASNYPLALAAGTNQFTTSNGPRSFIIDDANDLGFGAGALVVAMSNGVRIYNGGSSNSYTDFAGLSFTPGRLTLMPGALIANNRWWWIGLSTTWGTTPWGSNPVWRVGNRLWWMGYNGTTWTTYYMDSDFVSQTAVSITITDLASGTGSRPESNFVAGPAGQFAYYTRSVGTSTAHRFLYRPNDTTSPWVTISPSEFWNVNEACVDDEGLWYVDGPGRYLSLISPSGTQSFFEDILPFPSNVTGTPILVPLGNRNFFWASSYTSGSTQYPTIWNLSTLGSTLLLEGEGGSGIAGNPGLQNAERYATAVGRAANGDVYARFKGSPQLYRVSVS